MAYFKRYEYVTRSSPLSSPPSFLSSAPVSPVPSERKNRKRVVVVILLCVLFSVIVGGLAYGLKAGDPLASNKKTTVPNVITQPTTTFTIPPSVTTPKLKPLDSTPYSITVNGGTFMVVGGTVLLTFTVKSGDTLSQVSAWFKLLGGSAALKEWNHSSMDHPQLIIPGEVLTVTVPTKDIPKSSPVRLMDP